MASVNIDSDGVPFWEQIAGTRLDYTVDWTSWMPTGDIVTSALWSSSPAGLSVTSGTHSSAGVHTAWVTPSTGNANTDYVLKSKIFSDASRQNKQKIRIKVTD